MVAEKDLEDHILDLVAHIHLVGDKHWEPLDIDFDIGSEGMVSGHMIV